MFINQLKTVLLLGVLTAILLLVGDLLGGATGLTVAFVIVLLMNGVSYFFSDKIALMMYGAKEIKKGELPWLHKLVEELAKEAGIPKPKGIYVIPTSQANAFCAGRGPSHYVVAVTQGILGILSKEELRGVLAHEISHSKNRDVLITTIAATIAGVIFYVARMAQFAAVFGGYQNERESGQNIIGLIVLAIITPIVAMLIQLAISRSREYLADERGAKLIKDSNPLADALLKIEKSVSVNPLRFGNQATSSLFIENPFRGNGLLNLLSTHPPTAERVNRLRSMKF